MNKRGCKRGPPVTVRSATGAHTADPSLRHLREGAGNVDVHQSMNVELIILVRPTEQLNEPKSLEMLHDPSGRVCQISQGDKQLRDSVFLFA